MDYKPPTYKIPANSKYLRRQKVQCPKTLGSFNHKVTMEHGGKPPKLRFQPGTYLKLGGLLYEILYVYRVVDDPHTWLFCLEERTEVDESPDELGSICMAMGLGSTTPRIVYELFLNHQDAHTFFSDIPRLHDSRIVTNKTLMRDAEIVRRP